MSTKSNRMRAQNGDLEYNRDDRERSSPNRRVVYGAPNFGALKWPWHENENVSIKWAHGLLISENNIKVLDLIIWRSYSTPSNTGKSQFMIITTVEMIFWRFWKLERFPESKRPAYIFENLFQLHFERFRIVNWRIFGTGFSPIYIDFWWEPAIRPIFPVSPHRRPSF